MNTSNAASARAHARAMIERALTTENGTGGLAAAFDQLETRLRQPYARALTDEDRDDIRAYVSVRVDSLLELLGRTELDRVWSEHNDQLDELKDDLAR